MLENNSEHVVRAESQRLLCDRESPSNRQKSCKCRDLRSLLRTTTKIWQKGPDSRRHTSANAHHDLHVAEIARRQKVQTRQISVSCLGSPGLGPRAAISVNYPEFCTNCMSPPFVQDLRCPYGIPISCGHNM